jgi:SAM-dependent methyltransferase
MAADDEHYESLEYIRCFAAQLDARSILDTGCGTGRGIRFFREHMPDVEVHGNDPSPDLLKIATERYQISPSALHCSDTVSLPFARDSFDIVVSLAVLHHVPDPDSVVERMSQLARKGVFISDCNYIGQGRISTRLVKLALTEARLWPAVKFIQQGFRGWSYSEGDGVFYSYSAFSALPILRRHFRKVFTIPVGQGAPAAAAFPKLLAPNVLIGAMGKN